MSPIVQGADDETFNRLFRLPESSYQDFKGKHQAAKKSHMHPLRVQMQQSSKNFASIQGMDFRVEGHSLAGGANN